MPSGADSRLADRPRAERGLLGGEVIAAGPPEVVAADPRSLTGRFLREMLEATVALHSCHRHDQQSPDDEGVISRLLV